MSKRIKKKRKRKNLNALERRIYIPLSNVISAIIRLRHTSFQILMTGDFAIVKNLPLKSRYTKIRVYPNRNVKYMDSLGTALHEGSARSIGKIKKDILSWGTNSEASGTEEGDHLSSGKQGVPEPPLKGGFFRDKPSRRRPKKKKIKG